MTPLDKETFKQELKELEFTAPLAQIYVIVNNPEYDMETYSEELDKKHDEWNYPDYEGPISYQGYDEFGYYHQEEEEHKIWRLNHNKKYNKMKMVSNVTPKKNCNISYYMDEDSINNIVDNFKDYIVYSVSK